jgi:hypothetical protein
MATKRELKAEIMVLRKRVDELAARVAALEAQRWTWPVPPYTPAPGDTPWRDYPVITCTDTDSTSAMPRITWVRCGRNA